MARRPTRESDSSTLAVVACLVPPPAVGPGERWQLPNERPSGHSEGNCQQLFGTLSCPSPQSLVWAHRGAGNAAVPLSWEQSLSLGPCREQEGSAELQSRAVAGGAARTAVFSVPL